MEAAPEDFLPANFPPLSFPAFVWHATPLHYLPHLLASGALFSQAELKRRNLAVLPRPTAAKRDRKLGLHRFVHLSLLPQTPLLADKRAKGYPHALLGFCGPAVDALPGAGLVKYNAKSWRHREEFAVVTDAAQKRATLGEWREGKYPSLALLVPDCLPLCPSLDAIHFAADEDAAFFAAAGAALSLPLPPFAICPELFPPASASPDNGPLWEYAAALQKAGSILPPPNLLFD